MTPNLWSHLEHRLSGTIFQLLSESSIGSASYSLHIRQTFYQGNHVTRTPLQNAT
jgi:hypothetical protein